MIASLQFPRGTLAEFFLVDVFLSYVTTAFDGNENRQLDFSRDAEAVWPDEFDIMASCISSYYERSSRSFKCLLAYTAELAFAHTCIVVITSSILCPCNHKEL